MVEIFKTNVEKFSQAQILLRALFKHFPGYKINFDLEDCDKILRVQGESISSDKIIQLLAGENYQCRVLE